MDVVTARKTIVQRFRPDDRLLSLMETFRQMTNDSVRIGMEFEETSNGKQISMKRLSTLAYGILRRNYKVYSGYTLCAMSKAAGMLSARRKSIRRGFRTKTPYLSKPILVSCYGFEVRDGKLVFHLDRDTFESISLNAHVRALLADEILRVRSFTLSRESLSLCVSREVEEREVVGTTGIDRNLRNITAGDGRIVTFYNVSDVVQIGETTRSVMKSFKRNDARIKRSLSRKYGRRRNDRIKQILNHVSREIVERAKSCGHALVLENIDGIRRLYRRGNGKTRAFRARMNSWPFHEIKRQIEYKAAWEGIPVILLTRGETRGTTVDCARCGERLQEPVRNDIRHYRQLWCEGCQRWTDRDVVAVMNISRRGRLRFDRSTGKGEATEAVKGNAGHEGEPLILRVDASKLRSGRKAQ